MARAMGGKREPVNIQLDAEKLTAALRDVFSRIDEELRIASPDAKINPQTFLWRPFSNSMGEQKEILAGIYNKEHYDAPVGFRLDERNDDDV